MRREQTLQPTGPYTVRTNKFDLVDPYRMSFDQKGRLIPLLIYFPAKIGTHSTYDKVFEDRAPKVFPPLHCHIYSQESSLESLLDGKHPIVLFNHGHHAAMTDYACILEDLASHGYVIVAMQNQLENGQSKAPWADYSILKYATIIENNLFVFNWLQQNQGNVFGKKINLSKIALMGHSMGGNAMLLLSHRTTTMFRAGGSTLLPHGKIEDVKECIVAMDSGFTPPQIMQRSTFLCLAEERKEHQEKHGTIEALEQSGYELKHYPGSKHVSFMDHGWVLDAFEDAPEVSTFNGGLEARRSFFYSLNKDIRAFLAQCGVK